MNALELLTREVFAEFNVLDVDITVDADGTRNFAIKINPRGDKFLAQFGFGKIVGKITRELLEAARPSVERDIKDFYSGKLNI